MNIVYVTVDSHPKLILGVIFYKLFNDLEVGHYDIICTNIILLQGI